LYKIKHYGNKISGRIWKMKKLFAMVIVFIFLIPTMGLCQRDSSELNRQLKKEAKEINATLPKMMSKEMQLLKIDVRENNEFTLIIKSLFYSVSDLKNIIGWKEAMKQQTVNSICLKPDSVSLMRMGASFAYVYYDKHNKYVGEYSITKKDCE
jgi:hypothetical protein